MALLLATNVQLGPLAIPVEGDAVGALVQLIELPEVVIFDVAETVDVEEPEGDLVLGVGLCEDVLEVGPVRQGYPTLSGAVGDVEENRVLLALDLLLSIGHHM